MERKPTAGLVSLFDLFILRCRGNQSVGASFPFGRRGSLTLDSIIHLSICKGEITTWVIPTRSNVALLLQYNTPSTVFLLLPRAQQLRSLSKTKAPQVAPKCREHGFTYRAPDMILLVHYDQSWSYRVPSGLSQYGRTRCRGSNTRYRR